jgi:ribosome biogenesis GTPase
VTTDFDDIAYDLASLGYGPRWEQAFAPLVADGLEPARVVRVDREFPLVATASGMVRAEPAVHLVKTRGPDSRAVVGDWVALARPEGHDLAIIEAILPRTSAFSRKDPGEETGEQVVIANADVVFVVQSLSGRGLNLRRLERELVLAHESGATPVIVLTKADLVADAEESAEQARAIALGVDVIVESAVTGTGMDEVRARVPAGSTAALLGGSGVGKSTLVNRLVGEEVLDTRETRESDDKGRHTTVAREIVVLPGGGAIIDTPGMRGLGLWDARDGMSAAFPDIEALAEECRFADCRHDAEPGCAVRAAVESGQLSERRFESWERLRDELDELAVRQDERAWRQSEKREGKALGKAIKRYFKEHPTNKGKHR